LIIAQLFPKLSGFGGKSVSYGNGQTVGGIIGLWYFFKTEQSFDHLPDSANVRLPTVKKLYGASSATIWRHAGKTIPAPRKLTPRITAWNVGELRLALGIKRLCHC